MAVTVLLQAAREITGAARVIAAERAERARVRERARAQIARIQAVRGVVLEVLDAAGQPRSPP